MCDQWATTAVGDAGAMTIMKQGPTVQRPDQEVAAPNGHERMAVGASPPVPTKERSPRERSSGPRSAAATFTFDLAIVGLGYVGLPTALAFHSNGMRVLGVDIDPSRLRAISRQEVDLIPGDRGRLADALDEGTGGVPGCLELTADTSRLQDAACVVICVPTPVDAHHVPDLDALHRACATVVAGAVRGQTIVLTSTTYVGTTRDLLAKPLLERGLAVGPDVSVAFSPERINPGIETTVHEDVPRVVGGVTDACTRRAADHLSRSVRLVHSVSSPEAAELTKLLENTFRAVNIAMVNEFADIGQELGVDIMEVIDAASTKPFGYMRFTPGPGVGGHCIPCDPHYLTWQLQRTRTRAPLIAQAMVAIAARPHQVIDRVRELLSLHRRALTGARLLMVGVAYKPNVADHRESPAVDIIEQLRRHGAGVDYHDGRVPHLQVGGRCCSRCRTPGVRTPTGSSARRCCRGGPTPRPRPWTRPSPSSTTCTTPCRPSSFGCSTPPGHARPGATAWWCRASCARP